MMAGIMMVSLWIFLPRWRILTVLICILFGISRLAAGAHYPTDVVAGLTIGFVATWWVARYMATRNIIFLWMKKARCRISDFHHRLSSGMRIWNGYNL